MGREVTGLQRRPVETTLPERASMTQRDGAEATDGFGWTAIEAGERRACLSRLFAYEHGNRTQTEDPGGLTAKEELGQAAASMRGHYNQVAFYRFRGFDDAFGRELAFDVHSHALNTALL